MFAWLHHTSHDGGTMYIMDNMLHYSYMVEPWPNVMCALSSWSALVDWTAGIFRYPVYTCMITL